jgi:hypothetical protein
VLGLLSGAPCCPHGDCALCEESQNYQRRTGVLEPAVAESWVRMRLMRRESCPACGFPPPPAPEEIAPLPRFDRTGVLAGRTRCRYCDRRIAGTRRRYCDDDCWKAYVVWSRSLERDGVAPV